MLSLDTAYRSFGGEVEASSTPTICRLPDSRRHQLSAIAPSGSLFAGVAFTWHPGTADAAKFFVPCPVGMVFADPPYAETNGAVLIHTYKLSWDSLTTLITTRCRSICATSAYKKARVASDEAVFCCLFRTLRLLSELRRRGIPRSLSIAIARFFA